MAESVESVKAVAAFLRGAAEKNANPETRALLLAHADTVDGAAADLIYLKGITSALPPDLGNIYDLPAELLEELSVAKTDDLEDQLVTVINAYGGEASLDQVLVGLFRKFKVSQKRRFIQNKLYRMDMIWSVDGRKGYYTTTKPEDIQTAPVGYSYDRGASIDDMADEVPF
jgi:hypothetical protein